MYNKQISQKIINYALWYYLKYYPSVYKLRQKLRLKFWPESEKWKKYWWIFEDDIDWIVKEKLWNILVENEIIDSHIRNYKFKGKSKRYIIGKMFEKWFVKEDYEPVLEEYYKDWEWEMLEREICKRFKILDISEAKEIFEKLEFKQKNKITQSIIRKWFNYQDIKNYL